MNGFMRFFFFCVTTLWVSKRFGPKWVPLFILLFIVGCIAFIGNAFLLQHLTVMMLQNG